MTKHIPLSNGGFATVDDEDFERVSAFGWRLGNRGYVMRREYIRGTGGKGKVSRYRTILLHRVLLGATGGVHVDHVDGDTLNFRRRNLRLCTNAQNSRNRHGAKSRSGYKGVSRVKGSPRWRARLMLDHKEQYLGMFDTPEAAARAYDRAAARHFGAFACPNFPAEGLD